jgi:hypothetical protein
LDCVSNDGRSRDRKTGVGEKRRTWVEKNKVDGRKLDLKWRGRFGGEGER